MPPVARQCSRLVRLLVVLWAVGRSTASQSQQSPGVGTDLGPDQLLRLIVQDVTANIQPLITKLASRFDGLDARLSGLDTRLNGIETRLNSLRFKQDSFDARLDGLDTRVDELNSVVGGVGSRLDELAANMDSADRLVDSRLDELISRVNSTEGNLGSRLDELTSEVDSAENRLGARLDELISRVNYTEGSFDSRLDEVVSRVEGLAAERGGHLDVSSHLDQLSSRLDELANLTDRRLQPPRDCSELPAGSQSGIHLLKPGLDRSQPPVAAYCDLDTDGGRWTVIQRRADVQPRQDFNLAWSAYREGFGDLEAEFWWGLESLWRLTGSQHRQFELRVNLADFDGQRRYASYGKFTVASEADGYRLAVGDYTGDAGDSLDYHSGYRFSTKDREHDTSVKRHCAQVYKAGWWFKSCYVSNLNGQYRTGPQIFSEGVTWDGWREDYSLKEAEMKVRPVNAD